jgi:hypothetical protein
LSNGDAFLAKNQSTASQNGVYTFNDQRQLTRLVDSAGNPATACPAELQTYLPDQSRPGYQVCVVKRQSRPQGNGCYGATPFARYVRDDAPPMCVAFCEQGEYVDMNDTCRPNISVEPLPAGVPTSDNRRPKAKRRFVKRGGTCRQC